jgi:hypothetical protein
MKKKYLRIKKDLEKILSDNFLNKDNIGDKHSDKSQKHLKKTVNLILNRFAEAHKQDHIFDTLNHTPQDNIIQFIFKEPIQCIKDFFNAVFGNIMTTICKFKRHDISFSSFAKQSIKASIKIMISCAMVAVMFIYALDSSAPAISILMIILALGFISRYYSHN